MLLTQFLLGKLHGVVLFRVLVLCTRVKVAAKMAGLLSNLYMQLLAKNDPLPINHMF